MDSLNKKLLQRAKYWSAGYEKRVHNKNILSSTQEHEITSFYGKYQDLFGISPIFHSFYLEKTGVYDLNYMPIDLYFCFVDPYFNDWEKGPVVDNKCTYAQVFKNIKQPKVLIYRINNIWVDSDYKLVTKDRFINIFKEYIGKEIVVKQAAESEGGKNVFFIKGANMFQKFSEACGSIKKDIVVQEAIKQHNVINYLNPTSINTVRVLSLLEQDGVKICSSLIRMGIDGKRVDNISQGDICCGIDRQGRLKDTAWNYRGEKYNRHPTTNAKFDNVIIPNYNKVIELVNKAHPCIPNFRLVSWDICIDENGEPLLLEANLYYGELNLHQLTNGPVFGRATKRILDEVFSHSKTNGR